MSKKMIISAVVAGVVLLGGGGLFGWQFPLWLLGIVAFLVLGWSLMVRYKPRQVGSFVHFLVKRIPKGEKGKVFSENHQSGDWPEWFAKQNAEGWQLPECQLKTRWSKDINPRAPLPEYPRPQLTRDRWVNLNGLWSFNVVPEATVSVTEFPGKILVPYAIESALSGVQRPLFAGENLWYQRTFSVPSDWDGEERIVLHFGAVDWQTTVLVNGVEQGVHQGGYTPFSFDITDAVNRNKENQLTVIVWDPTNSDGSSQQRGKQALVPQFISYTASSGIWQTVWMEPVAERHIDRIVTTANIAKGTALLDVQTIGDCDGLTVEVTLAGERQKFTAGVGQPVLVKPDEIRLWTPETPNLYDISVRLLDGDKVVDETDSYFALREVGTVRQGDSTLLTLNGKPVFHNGPLDQGYWPDGIYTAATDEALKYDIELAKSYGFNMLRKHIKVEPARWYYHADKLGIMVWQDMISGGFTVPPRDGWVDYLQHVAPLGVKY
nr:hypothetical protein [Endozoicomonas sp.]